MPIFDARMPHTAFSASDATVDTPTRQNRLPDALHATSSPHRCQCPELGQECPACRAYRLGPKDGVSRNASTHRSAYLGNISVLLGTRRGTAKSREQRQAGVLAGVAQWVERTGRLPLTTDFQRHAGEVGVSMNLVYKAFGGLEDVYRACLAQGLCTARMVAAARAVQRRANQANGAKARRKEFAHAG